MGVRAAKLWLDKKSRSIVSMIAGALIVLVCVFSHEGQGCVFVFVDLLQF